MDVGVIRHIGIEGLGSIEDVLSGSHITPVYFDTWKTALPQDLSAYKAFIILGGPMGVYEQDRYPFIGDELQLIQKARKAGLPLIGICLGSQMLAQALGGRVYRGGTKEIGWYNVTLSGQAQDDPVFSSLSGEGSKALKVFQWHGDTYDLPPGAVLLAGSALFPNQAFRIDDSIYGLQFHVEIKEADVASWIKAYKEEIDSLKQPLDIDQIHRDTQSYIGDLNNASTRFFKQFVSLI